MNDTESEPIYRAYRTHEGRKTIEIFRWDKERAKAEIATKANIPQPEWRPRYQWAAHDEVADGPHGESQIVVTRERVK